MDMRSYLMLYVGMFLIYFGSTTYSEVKGKTILETPQSQESDHSFSTRYETGFRDIKMHQNITRYLSRRSTKTSGNKTISLGKESQIDTDDNSTATKLTGKDSSTNKGIPLNPGEPDPLPFVPPTHLSCSKSIESCQNRCSNETRFVASHREIVPLCSCDTSCNGLFMDCCSDYTKHCGGNTVVPSEPVYEARSYLQCESKLDLSLAPCERPVGVWMIKQCPMQWFDDVVRSKCEAPSMSLDNRAYGTLVPVYSGVTNLTYRNQYCAICHNVTSYEFWELTFREQATPPSHFNKETLMAFLSSNSKRYFRGIRPKRSFYVRYCYYRNIVKSCPSSRDADHVRCVNGTVELVHSSDEVYKNRACSSCRGVKSPCSIGIVSPSKCFVFPGIISRAVDLQDYGFVSRTKTCPERQVYDPYISTCRPSYQPLLLNSSVDSYKIIMAVLKYASTPQFSESQLQETIARNFNFSIGQVRKIEIAKLEDQFIILFNLHLTPLQSLIIASGGNYPKSFKLWRLLTFQNPFPLILSDTANLTVFRVKVRRLACIHWIVYQYHDYTILQDRRLFINKTEITYEEYEYELSGSALNRKATVCSKLAPFRINGSYISLDPSEYTLLPNLTLIYKNTRYNFGEYAYINGTVYIFVAFKREHEESTFFGNDVELSIVNFCCFILSEVFLVALIVTYLLFKELRTLPGKNLLNLAVSLSLADLFWLISAELTDSESVCIAIAILTHYFYMVYFTASSVIAYHSCIVFGRGIAVRPTQEEENRRFRIYFLITWFCPALFVALFTILDYTDSFVVDYGLVGGVSCFLGTKQAQIASFVTPIGVSLIFNVFMFIHVAKRFLKDQNTQYLSNELQRKRDRESVLICIRLSTLMGFSWLFLFLHLFLQSTTQAFLYLFVLFVGLQGVFVAVAFVFNRKCLGLYRALINSNVNRLSALKNTSSAADNTNSTNCQDTKL